jgi:hypothetical protein
MSRHLRERASGHTAVPSEDDLRNFRLRVGAQAIEAPWLPGRLVHLLLGHDRAGSIDGASGQGLHRCDIHQQIQLWE